MKGRSLQHAIALAVISTGILLLFSKGFLPHQVLDTSDTNLGWLTFRKTLQPAIFTGAFWPSPLAGMQSVELPAFYDVLLWLLPARIYNNCIYPAYLLLVAGSLYVLTQRWGLSVLSSAGAAVFATCTGWVTLVAGGHIGKFGVAGFGCLSLLCVHIAFATSSPHRQRRLFWVVGLMVGLMLMEQPDVGLLFGFLVLGAFFIEQRVHGPTSLRFFVSTLVPIAVGGILVAGPVMALAYKRNISEVRMMQAEPQANAKRWEFVTQWSFPPHEWQDLIAPCFQGIATGHPSMPYRGEIGRSASFKQDGTGFANFRLDSGYLGVAMFVLPMVAWVHAGRRRFSRSHRIYVWGWTALGALSLVLAFGKYTPLYRIVFNLPLIGGIRAPIKFLQLAQVSFALVSAFGLGVLWQGIRERDPDALSTLKPASFGAFGLSAAIGLSLVLLLIDRSGFEQNLVMVGIQQPSDPLIRAAAISLLRAFVLAVLVATGFAVLSLDIARKYHFGAALLAMALGFQVVEFAMVNRHYIRFEPLSRFISRSEVLAKILATQGHSRFMLLDSSGLHNRWNSVDFPYFGIASVNVVQMPRIPQDYELFLNALGNQALRLMQACAVSHVSIPGRLADEMKREGLIPHVFEPILHYHFVKRPDGSITTETSSQPVAGSYFLCRYRPTVGRFHGYPSWQPASVDDALKRLAEPGFDLTKQCVVASADGSVAPPPPAPVTSSDPVVTILELDRRRGLVKVNSPQPFILQFAQRWNVDWRVRVNGDEKPLLRCNYINQGVYLDAGVAEVEFRYQPAYGGLMVEMAGILVGLTALVSVIRPQS